MSVAKQLYQLQELDLELDSDEQALRRKTSQIGESREVIAAQATLTEGERRLDELRHQQHSTEQEIDDITSKIAAAEGQLYSGRITNPKELSSLQQEVNILKSHRDQLEDKALEIMDQVELTETGVADAGNHLKKLMGEWHMQQQQLSTDIEQLKSKLTDLKHRRELLVKGIDTQAAELYEKIRKQKGQALAKVEQGICRGCRISLPFSELQQARSGNLVQCGSCGRILFLP